MMLAKCEFQVSKGKSLNLRVDLLQIDSNVWCSARCGDDVRMMLVECNS